MKKQIAKNENLSYEKLVSAPLYLKHIFEPTHQGSAMAKQSWPVWSNHKEIAQALNDPTEIKFNIYCQGCQDYRIYKYADKAIITENWIKNNAGFKMFHDGIRYHEFQCSLNDKHRLNFTYKVGKDFIIKIGQFPSTADLEIIPKDYSKILDNDKVFEYKRAIGLKAFGVGIGSFVYLRRIIEYLIAQAHKKAIESPSWNESEYKDEDTKGKIKMLKNFLPNFLIDNKKIYSILSKGIHELEESACNMYFDVLKNSIEMILDEQLESERKAKKSDSLSRALDEIDEEIK